MKLAKVVPIFKQGSRFACSNYRPISVLSSISKIFERCIFNQLMFYFTNNNMISPKQYGFRPGFTTSDCLIDLIEEITSSLDKGLYVVSLFLDLSKAFDTVNHLIIYMKKFLDCDWLKKCSFLVTQCRKKVIDCRKKVI